MSQRTDITQLLVSWKAGNADALNDLVGALYTELHQLARSLLRRERTAKTLQPTALINEAILRLMGSSQPDWESRRQFVGIAARVMRRILVDQARSRQAAKRPQAANQVDLDFEAEIINLDQSAELLAVDSALQRLEQIDPRQARVVELKFFGGMTVDEIADVLEHSSATVTRDWRVAREWLRRELNSADKDEKQG